MTRDYDEPKYRAKIKQSPLDATQPSQSMPEKSQDDDWLPEKVPSGFPFKWVALLTGISCFIGFSVVEAVDTLLANFASYPVSTLVLGTFLTTFVACLLGLSVKEVRGYLSLKHHLNHHLDEEQILQASSPRQGLQLLKEHAAQFAPDSYAAYCYRQFLADINNDLTVDEIVALYETKVRKQVKIKAEAVLKKESMVSGSLSFISPNNLIQTLVVVWISLRTIKRLSMVFGVRASTAGNVKLAKILVQNLAAYSLFDLATDEITNQISGSLAAKFMENSAEAVAAGALNVRLGKALIKLMK
jgi:putative membrane protein